VNGVCTCGAIRHAITDEHRDALARALSAAIELDQQDLAEHYRYRLEPCPTATTDTTTEAEGSLT
jgi:uncharacterized protein YciW